MCRALHSRRFRNQYCLELTRIEVSPTTLLSMVVARTFRLAFSATELRTTSVFDIHADLLDFVVQMNVNDRPGRREPEHLLIRGFSIRCVKIEAVRQNLTHEPHSRFG